MAASTGFELPDSLQQEFPGAGDGGSEAGAKLQLVWEYKSYPYEPFALLPWNVQRAVGRRRLRSERLRG
jgi:hypothetical protein